MDTLRIGLVSISDRASSGVYQDKGIPALEVARFCADHAFRGPAALNS